MCHNVCSLKVQTFHLVEASTNLSRGFVIVVGIVIRGMKFPVKPLTTKPFLLILHT